MKCLMVVLMVVLLSCKGATYQVEHDSPNFSTPEMAISTFEDMEWGTDTAEMYYQEIDTVDCYCFYDSAGYVKVRDMERYIKRNRFTYYFETATDSCLIIIPRE